MIKKYSKVLLVLVAFFVSLVNVNAVEFTADELADSLKETNPDATYVYVIGEYVFTSEHILTTQDVMLAARSIKVSDRTGETNRDDIYAEMAMWQLDCLFDEDYNISGLKEAVNVFDSKMEAPEKFDVSYISFECA